MMEHIRQFDWCTSGGERYFVEESDIDNCATEKIIRNKFYDPLVSSDSENETSTIINWHQILKSKENAENTNRLYIPGLRAVPTFPKLSALTSQQHMQCLKVLCDANPHILSAEFMRRPTKMDHRVFEEIKETYAKEQKEFAEWAKTLWVNNFCIRALRPKPLVEAVYEAEYKMRAQRIQGFPRKYEMAAQIPLDTKSVDCEMVHVQDLININATELPEIDVPDEIDKKINIMRPCTVPEPCIKHPCQFILPTESSLSILPLPEIHRELAQYALDHGASFIASESALKCLVETDRNWAIPLSVCEVINPDGERCNVTVLGSEFAISKQSAPVRTYKAYKHMLEHILIPSSERMRVLNRGENTCKRKSSITQLDTSIPDDGDDVDSDDDADNLFIDTEYDTQTRNTKTQEATKWDDQENNEEMENHVEDSLEKTTQCSKEAVDVISDGIANDIGIYSCTCRDSLFEPAPRSYRKWQVRDNSSRENYDIIVHCPHKARSKRGEVLIEPIPEYQIELGATLQSQEKIRSIALSLSLRRNASVLNVRVEGASGDVVSHERLLPQEQQQQQQQQRQQLCASAAAAVLAALGQLQGLLPGSYLLQHEPSHGSNALLFAPRALRSSQQLQLHFSTSLDSDDVADVKTPPTLTPILLPWHKFRKILPCAFSPYADHIAKEPKKAVTKQKAPPQAIKWPKKKQKKKKNNQN